MECVGTWRQHRRELVAGRALNVAKEALLLRRAAPAILDRDAMTVREYKGRDIERIAKGMFRDPGADLSIHATAGIGGNLLDLGDGRTEPFVRGRLHRICDPLIER